MGFLLRKKHSKASLKAKDDRVPTPPPQLPPLPDHVRRDANGNITTSSPSPNTKAMRRRSRSLWAASEEARSAVAARGLSTSAGDLAAQPWRSREAWAALHNPSPPAILSDLTVPCSPLAQPTPGWRGKGGGGFFGRDGETDHETIRRADKTPGSPRVMDSPRRTRVREASPPMDISRKLDFGSSKALPSPPKHVEVVPELSPRRLSPSKTSPQLSRQAAEPVTPRLARTRDELVSPPTPNVLLTPNSTLLPSFSNRTPSPAENHSERSSERSNSSSQSSVPSHVLTPSTPSRPSRALPALPPPQTIPVAESDDEAVFHSATEEDEEVIHITASPRRAPVPKSRSASHHTSSRGSTPHSAPTSAPHSVSRSSAATSTPASSSSSPHHAQIACPPTPVIASPPVSSAPALYAAGRPPSRTASSSSQKSSSHGHEPPHTPDGIARAVQVWRNKSQRKQDEKEYDGPDVFAAAGAWEAPGSYTPYEDNDFTDEPGFTPPLRLPAVPREMLPSRQEFIQPKYAPPQRLPMVHAPTRPMPPSYPQGYGYAQPIHPQQVQRPRRTSNRRPTQAMAQSWV